MKREEGKAEFDFSPSAFVDPAKTRRRRKKKQKKKICRSLYVIIKTDIWLQRRVTQLFCWTQEEGKKQEEQKSFSERRARGWREGPRRTRA